jgi:hypothetical protein
MLLKAVASFDTADKWKHLDDVVLHVSTRALQQLKRLDHKAVYFCLYKPLPKEKPHYEKEKPHRIRMRTTCHKKEMATKA